MTLSGDISTTSSSLNDIKNAIITKGGSITGNITTYATSINNLPENIVVKRVVSPQGVYQFPTTYSLPENAIDVGDYALDYSFYRCTSLTSVDLSSLTTISGNYALQNAFRNCTSLESIDLSSLTTISGNNSLDYAFSDCESLTSVSFPSLTTISGNYALQNAFLSCGSLTSVSFPSLTTISGNYALDSAFESCTSLTSASFPLLTTISEEFAFFETFQNCTSLTSIDLSSLTIGSLYETFYGCESLESVDLSSLITGSLEGTFYGCTSLTSVDLSSLTTVSEDYALSSAFSGCTSLTSLSFPSLTTISGSGALSSAFSDCTSLTSLSFPSLTSTSFGDYTDQFNYMLYNVTGCTVHFPSNLQSIIGNWTSVTSGFGGTDTTVLFDLSNSQRAAYNYTERVYYSEDPDDYEDIDHTIYTDENTTLILPSVGDTMYYIKNNTYSPIGTVSAKNGDEITIAEANDYVSSSTTTATSLTYNGMNYSTFKIVITLIGRSGTGETLNISFYDESNHEIDTMTYPGSTVPPTVNVTSIPYGTAKVTATIISASGRSIERIYNYWGGQTYTRDSSKDIVD